MKWLPTWVKDGAVLSPAHRQVISVWRDSGETSLDVFVTSFISLSFISLSLPWNSLVLFLDSLLPRPENGPEPRREKKEYLQAHARNDAIFSPKTGGKTIFGKRFLIWAEFIRSVFILKTWQVI